MRIGTNKLGAALLATGLLALAAACGSGGSDCKKACTKVTQCLNPKTGDGGATKADGSAKKDDPGPASCGLSEACTPKESCLAGCLLAASCDAILGKDAAGQATMVKCQAECNAKQWDGGATDGGDKKDTGTVKQDKGTCQPSCSGKQCGPDGCGGSCGSCNAPEVCNTAQAKCVSTCSPNCTDRQCGGNGCGGSCGTCPTSQNCDSAGHCICQPSCSGKQCGPDGCGDVCGTCPPDHSCEPNGACVCLPQCGTKQCGGDGCGGNCGTCPGAHICDSAGMCIPP